MSVEPFPSLIIGRSERRAQGSFAQAQAQFLDPDGDAVSRLASALEALGVGIVAHYYMDPELQGVLAGVRDRHWQHIQISDSLAMADRAIAMAEAGLEHIVVLGVDFMSENVRAMLDATGHSNVQVYRACADEIGCSLAESADAETYLEWLAEVKSRHAKALHVVYINTSLLAKARAHVIVPTVTCTSSNVVNTVLSAAAQDNDLHICFGPDTYMGENLRKMFETYAEFGDAQIAKIHPAHNRRSIEDLLGRFEYYKNGNCIVHHMFGAEVVAITRRHYQDVNVAAHLEVPGEMFRLALETQADGRGVVGSTSNILSFILEKAQNGLASGKKERFILGTEAGMVTSIVGAVEQLLRAQQSDSSVEIIFPVASDAISETSSSEVDGLKVVPGVSAGEGCTVAGGCASCPYMKMNSLARLFDVLDGLRDARDLSAVFPKTYQETISGKTVAEVGSEPIVHMRTFQKSGKFAAELFSYSAR